MTIELPFYAKQATFSAEFLDAGFTQRGISSIQYIPRKGGRYKVAFNYAVFSDPSQARVIVARLIRGKQVGIRVPLPLLHNQGNPGAPLVDGTNSGRTLAIKGLTPNYIVKEGYWLSIIKDGQHYLHNVAEGGQATDSGTLTITLNELLRTDFANNSVIHLAQPMVEGIVEGDTAAWNFGVDRVLPIEFAIEERD
jgi:hypothetical protein